jgi:cytidine deaminase
VLTSAGRIVTGCNVENASYGLSLCAERVAIHRAIAEGHRGLEAVAVSAGPRGKPPVGATPCGACRQVLAEFGVKVVILDDPNAGPGEILFGDLLPHPFEATSLAMKPSTPPGTQRRRTG